MARASLFSRKPQPKLSRKIVFIGGAIFISILTIGMLYRVMTHSTLTDQRKAKEAKEAASKNAQLRTGNADGISDIWDRAAKDLKQTTPSGDSSAVASVAQETIRSGAPLNAKGQSSTSSGANTAADLPNGVTQRSGNNPQKTTSNTGAAASRGGSSGAFSADDYEKLKLEKARSAEAAFRGGLDAYEFSEGTGKATSTASNSVGSVLSAIDAQSNQIAKSSSNSGNGDLSALEAQKLLNAANAPTAQTPGDKSNANFLKATAQTKTLPPLPAPTPQTSRYLLHQTCIIKAAMLTDINSDLKGSLKALVTKDVYDCINVDEATPLIRKGTILSGEYNTEIVPGQARILGAFNRIIFPNGASLDIGAMTASDGGGASGIEADRDTHFWRMFGMSFLVAGIAAVVPNPSTTNNISINAGGGVQSMSAAGGQVLVDTVQKIMNRNQTIKDTLTVKKGERFTIIVNRDMYLPPQITQTRTAFIDE